MFYVVQKNVFRDENYENLVLTLDKLGLEYEVIDCLPFVQELEFNTTRKDVFCFGSVKMANLARKNDWIPGSFYGGNHDYLIYKDHYKENLLNYNCKIQKFSEPIDFYREVLVGSSEGFQEVFKFIRPTTDSKVFNGATYSKCKWEDLVERALNSNHVTSLNADTLIQVNDVHRIYKEARVWIVDGKVITTSYYKFHNNAVWTPDLDPEGLEFAQSMADLYKVADAFVMDICLTPEGWRIVEINCINCAGFYQGDLQKIIIALEDKFN